MARNPTDLIDLIRGAKRWSLWLLIVLAGCSSKSGQQVASPMVGGGAAQFASGRITPDEVQSAVMSFADRFVQSVADAADRVAEGAGREARLWLLRNKTATAQGAYTIAAGPNPVVAMLDMTVLATLKRMVMEEYWVGQLPGADLKPLMESYQQNENDIWTLAREILTDEGEWELHEVIRRWRADHPDQRYVCHTRFSNFDVFRNRPSEPKAARTSSVFALLYLDPLAGMDPTARELGQLRRMAERESYFLERMPIIMSYLVPQMGAEYMDSPDAREVLGNISGFVGAAEKFAVASERFATELGEQGQVVVDKIAAATAKEGEAVIKQVSEVLGRERAALMADLSKLLDAQRAAIAGDMEAHEQQVRGVLAEVKTTAESLRAVSESVRGTIGAADALVARIDAPDKPGEESHPFDVREYESAAAKISDAAREVTRTIEAIERPPPTAPGAPESKDGTALAQTVATLEGALGRTIDRAFSRLLLLAGVVIVGWGVVWLVVRRLGRAR